MNVHHSLIANKPILSIIRIILLFILCFFIGSCQERNEEASPNQIVVTQVYDVIGEEVVVTRIIEITPIPSPPPTPSAEEIKPVALDISFILESAPSIDPQQPFTQDGLNLIENIFVGLTRFNHSTNQVDPALAREWEVTENGRVWTFFLRDDIYWVMPIEDEEGNQTVEAVRPVTANDVVFAIQRACSQQPNTPDAFSLFIIEGCEVVHSIAEPTPADLEQIGVKALNNSTLQFSLTKPVAHFLTLTSLGNMRPLPKEIIETFGDNWQTDNDFDEDVPFMTSGPFFPHNTQLKTLQSNPLWPLSREDDANVDIVNVLYLDNPDDAFEIWQDRQLDIIDLSGINVNSLGERVQQRVRFVPGQTLHYIGFNFESGVFREAEIRRAFSAAIDRERLVEELFGTEAIGMRHLIPPGVVGASPVDQVGVGYSPDYARQQLAESGFRNCQLIPEITLLASSSDLSLQQAELVREMWVEELECNEDQIKIDQVQFGTLLANTRSEAGEVRPDLWELAWASYYPDAQNWMGDLLHCQESENRPKRPCSTIDELIRQSNNTFDTSERISLYRELEHMLFGENGIMPIAPLYLRGESILVQGWLTHTPALFGGEQYDTYVIDEVEKELQRSR